jgi:dihydroneopterin aldolase
LQPLKIGIDRLKVMTSVGIYAAEKKKKQPLYISAILFYRHAGYHVDDMSASMDYDILCNEIKRVAGLRHYELIENLALHTGQALRKLAQCDRVEIRIDKPLAARKNGAESIWVVVETQD